MAYRQGCLKGVCILSTALLASCGSASTSENEFLVAAEEFNQAIEEAINEIENNAALAELEQAELDAAANTNTNTNTNTEQTTEEPVTNVPIDDDSQTTTTSERSTALAYSNGYTLTTALVQSPFDEDQIINFTVDTEAKTIFNDDQEARFDDAIYDSQGRVEEFSILISYGSDGKTVEYNADGTVDTITSVGNITTYVTEFTYEAGDIASWTYVSYEEGVVTRRTVTDYYYENGLLAYARKNDRETGQPIDEGYDYTVDASGRIIEVLNVNQLFTNNSRYVFTYDDNQNIENYDIYNEDGGLIRSWTFTYTPNLEPTPNLVGFLFAVDAGLNQF